MPPRRSPAAPWAFALGGHYLIALLTGLPEVRTAAGEYLPWMVVMPLIAVWSYLFDGVFIGATAIREMRNSIFFGLVLYLPVWWGARAIAAPGYENHALWLAFLTFSVVRSAVLVGYYWHHRRTRWRHGSCSEAAIRTSDRPS